MRTPTFLIIDLFCGAGGTTTGFAMANREGNDIAKVIACVNHDWKAIKSHWQNHPEVEHYTEDIRTLELRPLVELLNKNRVVYPDAKVILWASLECTNFSKAKGGQPRDADSRTLAEHLDRYILALEPDYIQIENVVEFMSWGPLDAHGKPVSRKSGVDWMRWRNHIDSFGYRNEWRELNSADYGAYTSRNRLFGCFAKPGLPIVWPPATHGKKSATGNMFAANVTKWKAVKEVLDFEDEGESIFTRKKTLVDASLERIEAGIIKFVAGGKDAFIVKYNSMDKKGKHNSPSVDEPCPTIACQNRLGMCFIAKYYSGKPAGKVIPVTGPSGSITCVDGQSLVQPKFIASSNGGLPSAKVSSVENPSRVITASDNKAVVQCFFSPKFIVQRNSAKANGRVISVDQPARTLTATGGNQELVQPEFLLNYNHSSNVNSIDKPSPTLLTRDKLGIGKTCFLTKYHGNGENIKSVDEPASTLSTRDRLAIVQPVWLDKTFSGNANIASIESPAGTLMPCDKHRLINCEALLLNPAFGGQYHSVDVPSPVIVAIQDKKPLYFIQFKFEKHVTIPVYDTDSPVMVRIKNLMALYGISDIKMRMLKVLELLKIQGFPDNYHLFGNQSDKKKFIGNSVVPHVVKAWCEAMDKRLLEGLEAA